MAGWHSASALPDFDEVTVGVTQVAADLRATIDRFGEELRALGRPVGVYGGDVGNTDIQERADPVRIVRGLERDRGFVVRGAAAGVDDDPAVGQRHDRRLAIHQRLATENLGVEGPRAVDIVGDEEMCEHDALGWGGKLCHDATPIGDVGGASAAPSGTGSWV